MGVRDSSVVTTGFCWRYTVFRRIRANTTRPSVRCPTFKLCVYCEFFRILYCRHLGPAIRLTALGDTTTRKSVQSGLQTKTPWWRFSTTSSSIMLALTSRIWFSYNSLHNLCLFRLSTLRALKTIRVWVMKSPIQSVSVGHSTANTRSSRPLTKPSIALIMATPRSRTLLPMSRKKVGRCSIS